MPNQYIQSSALDLWLGVLVTGQQELVFDPDLSLRDSADYWLFSLVFGSYGLRCSCSQALMTASAKLSQKGKTVKVQLRATGSVVVVVAGNERESKWSGGSRRQYVSSCASSVAQLGLSAALCSGARLSCRHHGQTPLIRLASTLQAAEIQRRSTAEDGQNDPERGAEAPHSQWPPVSVCADSSALIRARYKASHML